MATTNDTERTELGLTGRVLVAGVRIYQFLGSPILGGHCRFQPSCSAYAAEAIRRHGAWRGGRLTMSRLWRCRPGGGSGLDPVPNRVRRP